jgi:hypothetical protein
MKKLLVVVFLLGALISFADAKGQKVFDLKNQYFSGTLIKKGQEGYGKEQKYDVGKVYVTTDTIFTGKSYKYGLFTVNLKEPLENWNVNIKKFNGNSYKNDEMTTIRLTSAIGNNYMITFGNHNSLQINDKNFKVEIYHQKLTITVKKQNSKTIFYINGQKFLKIDAKDFGKLAKVEVELNDNHYDDELHALEIYKVE